MQRSGDILNLPTWNRYLKARLELAVERTPLATVTAVLPLTEESVHTLAPLATKSETKLPQLEGSPHHKVEIAGTKGLPVNISRFKYEK